jgi:thiol-disulfide isomerase/thioredoxin
MRVTLLGRAGCHLCDEMRSALAPLAEANGLVVVEVDVDGDPALEARYGAFVPVLLVGDAPQGVEVSRYVLDRARLLAAVAARWRDVPGAG